MQKVVLVILISINLFWLNLNAQTTPIAKSGSEIDSLRKQDEESLDSVETTAKYIRYTTLGLLKDSTRTVQLDTTLRNVENYSPIYQPHNPTIGLGNLGLSYRSLLFDAKKSIGFDAGFHSLDLYKLIQDSVRYYRARAPYTELYYVSGSETEQVFKVTHSQNIKPNWNFAAFYNRIGAMGFYRNQKADHLNAAVSTWYESPSRRYNVVLNGLFNTLKAAENGSIKNDSIFNSSSLRKDAEVVRFSKDRANLSRQTWREKNFYIKQFYYIGRIDTTAEEGNSSAVLPTQRVSHALTYTSNNYKYRRNELDSYGALPHLFADSLVSTNDSTLVSNLRNEFSYSFYLRGKAVSFIKNEVKLDLGIQNDLYWYDQLGYELKFQNTALKAGVGYRFSDRVTIDGDLEQLVSGRNAGDYLYDAKTKFLLSKAVGQIVLGAYLQNKSPEQMFERVGYQYHAWSYQFDHTKTANLSFRYDNPKYDFFAKAEYFLITNHLYYQETINKFIIPVQADKGISLLRISGGKNFKFGRFNLESYLVYQKSNLPSILRTPEIYTYQSFYYNNRLFKVLQTNIGFDVRYNTPFSAPAYAIGVSQFYNDNAAVEFNTYPIVNAWIKATLRRATIFFKYDYANQGLLSRGYYTINRYPMGDALMKFGVAWKFYD